MPRLALALCVLLLAGGASAEQQCIPLCPQPSACSLASQPALTGAGPAPSLAAYTGPAFDQVYMLSMYQQHADIAALAAFAGPRLVSPELRRFSGKIVDERQDMNRKLAAWYPRYTGQALPALGTARVAQIGNAMVACAATDLDREYARTMISLMAQSRDAANLGTQRLTRADIRDQARLVARVNENEMAAFQRWLTTGFLTEFDQQRYECALYGNCPWGYGYPGWWY